MKVIIGIGNPEPKYNKTRHNVGKLVVDLLGDIEGFRLVKASGFMNESGSFVLKYLIDQKITPQDIVIVHDDWAFDVGQFKLQINRNHNNHNGVRDIITKLNTKKFWRLRVGIGMNLSSSEPSDFVLSRFTALEVQNIQAQIPLMKERLRSIMENQVNF